MRITPIKSISLIVVVIFLSQEILWAYPQSFACLRPRAMAETSSPRTITTEVSSPFLKKKRELRLRISDFEDYPAPLSEKGRSIIEKARSVLNAETSASEQIDGVLTELNNPELDWFEPLFKEFGEYEKALLRRIHFFNFTWGCPMQCAFCFSNAPQHITSMPWAWVVELKGRLDAIGRTAKSSPLWSDPLRSYYDRVFRKDYGDVAILHGLGDHIDTSGFPPNSLGEKAARKIISHFAVQGEKVRACLQINVVNDWISTAGEEKYIKCMRHVADVFGRKNVQFTTFGNVSKKDRIDAVSVLKKITGDKYVSDAGGVYAGKIRHLDVSKYTMFIENFHRPLFSGMHLMPNGDIVRGPFDAGATEYKCLRKHPDSGPLENVRYVTKTPPEFLYTDQSEMHFVWFNDLYDYYDKNDRILYNRLFGRDRGLPKAIQREQNIGDFWERFLKRFMEEAHDPALRDLKPEFFSYALVLSAIDVSWLSNEYARLYAEVVLKKDLKDVKRSEITDLERHAHFFTFGKMIKDVVEGYKAAPAEKKESYESFLLVCQEWIYRHWDISEKPPSYLMFRPPSDDLKEASFAAEKAKMAERYDLWASAANLWYAAAYYYSRGLELDSAELCVYFSAANWYKAGRRLTRGEYTDESALLCFRRSIDLLNSIGHKSGIALPLLQSAKAAGRSYRPEEAAEYAESAAERFNELDAHKMEAVAWTEAASCYSRLRDYERSGYCSRVAARIFARLEIKNGKDFAIQNYLRAARAFEEARMREASADCRAEADRICEVLIRKTMENRGRRKSKPANIFTWLSKKHNIIVKAYEADRLGNRLIGITTRFLTTTRGTNLNTDAAEINPVLIRAIASAA